jgi:hypothetical protein
LQTLSAVAEGLDPAAAAAVQDVCLPAAAAYAIATARGEAVAAALRIARPAHAVVAAASTGSCLSHPAVSE